MDSGTVMVEKWNSVMKQWNSNGEKVGGHSGTVRWNSVMEQWNSHGGTLWWNSGTLVVEKCVWNSGTVMLGQ